MVAASPAAFEIIGKIRKTKTPPATGAGGVLEKIPMICSDRELPACLLGKGIVRKA